jgi:hypothetical protein
MGKISTTFDEAVKLTEGQTISIPCDSKADLMSKKVLFYRERIRYCKLFPDTDVKIQQVIDIKKNTFTLKLSCGTDTTSWFKNLILTDKDGSTKLLNLQVKETAENGMNEKDRMRKLMEEDGLSPEEIEEALKNY